MNSRADAHRIEGREALVAVIIELLAQARQRVRLHAPGLKRASGPTRGWSMRSAVS